MTVHTYNIQEAKNNFSKLLHEAASGKEVIIAKAGKPLARVSKFDSGKLKIRFGVLKGKVTVADDFDAPLTEEILSEFENRS